MGIFCRPTKCPLFFGVHLRWRYHGEQEKVTVFMNLHSIGKMDKNQIIRQFEGIKCYKELKVRWKYKWWPGKGEEVIWSVYVGPSGKTTLRGRMCAQKPKYYKAVSLGRQKVRGSGEETGNRTALRLEWTWLILETARYVAGIRWAQESITDAVGEVREEITSLGGFCS